MIVKKTVRIDRIAKKKFFRVAGPERIGETLELYSFLNLAGQSFCEIKIENQKVVEKKFPNFIVGE